MGIISIVKKIIFFAFATNTVYASANFYSDWESDKEKTKSTHNHYKRYLNLFKRDYLKTNQRYIFNRILSDLCDNEVGHKTLIKLRSLLREYPYKLANQLIKNNELLERHRKSFLKNFGKMRVTLNYSISPGFAHYNKIIKRRAYNYNGQKWQRDRFPLKIYFNDISVATYCISSQGEKKNIERNNAPTYVILGHELFHCIDFLYSPERYCAAYNMFNYNLFPFYILPDSSSNVKYFSRKYWCNNVEVGAIVGYSKFSWESDNPLVSLNERKLKLAGGLPIRLWHAVDVPFKRIEGHLVFESPLKVLNLSQIP